MTNLSAASSYDHSTIVPLDSYIEDLSLTNATLEMVPDGKEVHIIVTCIFTAIFVVGVVGNAVLIFTVARNLSMQIPPNIFLANMAVGDLLIVLISVPFAIIPYITPSWPFGLILCKFNAMLQDISIGVSIFTLLILSVDRYVAIVTPFKLHNKRSTRGCSLSIKLKILAIWLVSAVFSIPDAINTSLEEVEDPYNVTAPIHICSPYPFALSREYHIGVVLGKFLVYFVLPVVFIVLVYSLMARQLISSTDMVPSHGNQQQLQKQMQTRKSLAKLFFIMVIVFILCFLPKHIFLIWFYGDPNSMENYNLGWHIFKIISHCLAYVNSCANPGMSTPVSSRKYEAREPVTLYFLSKVFRRYFDRYLRFGCKTREEDWPKLRRNEMTQSSRSELTSLNGFPLSLADRRKSGISTKSSVYSSKTSYGLRSTNYL